MADIVSRAQIMSDEEKPATTPPPLSTRPVSDPQPASESTKRPLARRTSSAKPTKRARASIGAHETVQVSNLARHRLDFADAECFYVKDFIDPQVAQAWHDELLTIDGWYQPTLKMYGKEITQSRKIAAFATDPDLTVKYSGALVDMRYEYPPLLRRIQDLVEERLGVKFNHCMMNSYENGQVYIGNHRDNRENRVIASVSLGAPRTFIMEHDNPPPDAPQGTVKRSRLGKLPPPSVSAMIKKYREEDARRNGEKLDEKEEGPAPLLYYKKWTLKNGSLVVMQGDTQLHWKHQIPREAKVKDSRISLTFRQLVF